VGRWRPAARLLGNCAASCAVRIVREGIKTGEDDGVDGQPASHEREADNVSACPRMSVRE
jgi:hypothetical protein